MTNDKEIILRVGHSSGFVFQRGRNDLALFASLGGAIAQVQSFELGIEGFLGWLSPKAAEESGLPIKDPDSFYTKTLGGLIRQFQKHLPDTGIAELLENVRVKRNYLVHQILRVYQWPIMNDDDYVRAIAEVEEIRAYIETAGVEVARYLSDRSLVSVLVIKFNLGTGEVNRIV